MKPKVIEALTKAVEALREEVSKSKLSADERNNLADSDFVFPDKAPGSGSYPIPDLAHARNALARSSGKPEEAKVRAAVQRRYPELSKADAEPGSVEVTVPLWKDDAKQIVYGVVLSPGVTDSQDDIATPDEIEKAAHRFLTEYRKHDVQHTEITRTAAGDPIAETVESFIAPQDMTIAGEKVLKGAWVLATHVSDPETWERVRKGEITGYSIGGTGERVPLAA